MKKLLHLPPNPHLHLHLRLHPHLLLPLPLPLFPPPSPPDLSFFTKEHPGLTFTFDASPFEPIPDPPFQETGTVFATLICKMATDAWSKEDKPVRQPQPTQVVAATASASASTSASASAPPSYSGGYDRN